MQRQQQWGQFQERARRSAVLHFGVQLEQGKVPGFPKGFDMVSSDKQVIGDAKYYALPETCNLSGKEATITQEVSRLELTYAPTLFIVFGKDRRMPLKWLRKYGDVPRRVAFYFLPDDGQQLELLAGPNT